MAGAGVDWKRRVAEAGFTLRAAKVGDVAFSYAEGPDNGPPLVLLHAQHMDWFSYSRVLPALSRRFHVFDIDYPGHGPTVVPAEYPMTANRIGADLAAFLEMMIGEPACVSGNSSGGLLTVWLAANRPDLVKSVVLEDPPLFAAEYPRIKTTIADRSFTTCSDAARDGVEDFLLYWIHSNKAFFRKNVAPGAAFLLTQAVKIYRRAHPGEPPALLVHAKFSVLPNGTLNGAMGQQDADKTMSLLPHGRYRRVDATHVVHLAAPDLYVRILEESFLTEAS